MTIESTHNAAHGRTAAAHATGKAGVALAADQADGVGDFSDLMGGLFAAGAGDAMPVAPSAPVAQADISIEPWVGGQMPDTVAVPLQQSPNAEDLTTPIADESVTPQGPAGRIDLVTDLVAQATAWVVAPASAPRAGVAPPASVVGPARLDTMVAGESAGSGHVSMRIDAGVVVDTVLADAALEPSAPVVPTGRGVTGKEALLRASERNPGVTNDRHQPALAAGWSLRMSPDVALPQAALVGPGFALALDGKERSKAAFAAELGGLAGAHLVSERLGISATYEVTSAAATVADTRVAETVSYWVAQGVQTAELTVDGLGMEPVEVHIALSGDQVQVDFRSDQQQVRQVIEAATAQLKGLLLTQGMELSAMSVGSFEQGTNPSGARTPRPNTSRVTGVRMAQDTQTVPLHRIDSPVGRALDLYV